MSKNELFCEKNGKLHVGHTVLTGFAFLASSIAWAIYDPYITKILNRLLTESAWITSLSAKLNEAFPILAKFAETQGQDVNVAGGGSVNGITNITTGSKKPEASHQLYIPVDESKGTPIAIMTFSDDAYNAKSGKTCGHIAMLNTFQSNGIKDVVGFTLIATEANGVEFYAIFNKAIGSGYDAEKGYLMDRASGTNSLDESHTFNYIVFYKPIGNLSFGGE